MKNSLLRDGNLLTSKIMNQVKEDVFLSNRNAGQTIQRGVSVYDEDSNGNNIIEEIIKLTYQCPIVFKPINEAKRVFVWIEDESMDCHIAINRIQAQCHICNEMIIIDSREQGIKQNKNYFKINKGSIAALVLGFINYFSMDTVKKLEDYFGKHKTVNTFQSLLDTYSLTNIEKWTGLSCDRILEIYNFLMIPNSAHHHLLMNISPYSSNDIQAARGIILLPKLAEATPSAFPLSYRGQERGEIPYAIEVYKRTSSTVQLTLPNSRRNYLIGGKRTFGSLVYNTELSEKFDVDPFPLYIPSRMEL